MEARAPVRNAIPAIGSFNIVALLAIIGITLSTAADTINAASLYFDFYPLSALAWSILGIGWIIASYGPILLAMSFHRVAKRVSHRWVLHVLFLPLAALLFAAGGSLMLFGLGDPDFDNTLGGPVVTGLFMLVVAVALYFAAAIWNWRSAQ